MKEQTMNIKPTSEQCQVWSSQAESFAINISSQGRHGGKGFAELFNTKFAELAAQWGAEQALRINTRDDNPTAIHDKARPRCICCGGVVMQEQGGGVCIPCAIEEGIKP